MKQYSLFSLLRGAIFMLLCTTACTKDIDKTSSVSDQQVNASTQKIYVVNVKTIAGKYGIQGDENGNGSNARFWNPTKVVYDYRNKTLYVADGTIIRSVDASNNVKTYLPLGKINNFDEILDIDLAPDSVGGSLYFITEFNGLYKIAKKGTSYKLTTIADRLYGGNQLGKLNTKDHFDLAYGLATGKNGDIFFFNQSWYTIHHIRFSSISPFAGDVLKFVGKAAATRGGDTWAFHDGRGDTATFNSAVNDMCADGKGNLYVADYRDDLVRRVTSSGIVKSLFQYKNGLGIDVDGSVSIAQANKVDNVSATSDGSEIFFTTYGRYGYHSPALRVVRPNIDVTTLVGKNPTAWGDGSGDVAGFGEIGGIAATPDGKTVYVSEVANKVIRKVTIQ